MPPKPAPTLIGIVACRKMIEPHWFHAVGEKYIAAIADAAGAVPLLLPALGERHLDELLDTVHGVFLTGSPSNVEPHHYDGPDSEPGTSHDPHRDATTLPLISRVIERGMPLFAVCRGFQEMNVALGGSLHAKVHEQSGMLVHHEDTVDPLDVQYGPVHGVNLAAGGLLESLAGDTRAQVNSLHHQGIDRLAPGLEVLATADDGLIEGFRVTQAPGFTLAVQWHPEWRVLDNPFSLAIFRAFGDACRRYAGETTLGETT
ncbi:MAG: gamma-glutamyl-gamma-aminobutyrate hydrolase family protein [Pseudomonadota bacterium]